MEAPVIGLSLYVVMIAIELLIIRYYKRQEVPWREVVINVNSGHILLWISRGGVLGIYYYVLSNWSFGWVEAWPKTVQWCFAFIVWDFCYYWSHRLHHQIKLLWKVHAVHHQGEHFSLSLGIRNSWFQSLTSLPFFLWLAVVGLPFEIYVAVTGIHITIQFYNHNQIIGKQGFLEWFMVTPTHHRIHHGVNLEYIDKNHGGTFIIWDKLFGTFAEAQPNVPIIYGTLPRFQSYDPIKANLELMVDQPQERGGNESPNRYPAGFIIFCGVALYTMLMTYIHYERIWSPSDKMYLGYLLFSGTVFIGGLSHGKRNMLILWISHMLILPGLFTLKSNSEGLIYYVSMAALFLTSLWGFRLLFKESKSL